MTTEFELQKGDGIAVDIVPANDEDDFWIIVDEDDLVKMIQIAWDAPKFTLNDLIDALRATERRKVSTTVTAQTRWPGE